MDYEVGAVLGRGAFGVVKDGVSRGLEIVCPQAPVERFGKMRGTIHSSYFYGDENDSGSISPSED